jgi:hypothetical protein
MRLLGCAFFLSSLLVSAAPPAAVAAPSSQRQTETAAQFYMRWRTAALTAKSMDEILPFLTSEMAGEFNMEPESAKADTLPMMKRFYGAQTGVRVVKETPTATGATLTLEGTDANQKPIVSSVDIVKEKGEWKMTGAVEQWNQKGH